MALTTSLVAYYKLDESSGDAADSVGSRSLINTATVAYSAALINNGGDVGTGNTTKYLRNNTDDYGISTGALSISIWHKQAAEIGSGNNGLAMHGSQAGLIDSCINYDFNGGTRRLIWNRQRQNAANDLISFNVTLGTTVWNHIVYVYDATNLSGYLNGTLVAGPTAFSGSGIGGVLLDGFTLFSNVNQIGSNQYGAICPSGLIDEVGIWSRDLTSSEVTQLYNGGVGLTYPFTGGTPTVFSQNNLLLLGVS